MTQVQRTRRPRPPQATHDVAALVADLNPEQRAVAEHRDGALLVPAVAGAGKTRALVHRIAVLVASGVPGARICAMTFSKAAAREMNERLFNLGITEANVGTAHSVALRILRDERPDLRSWRIDDSDQYRAIIKIVVGFRGMDWKAADLTECLGFITRCKAALALPGSDEAAEMARANFERRKIASRQPQRLLECYERAEAERESRQLLTFDDMLVMCWAMFRDVPEVLSRWQHRYDFVLQDEAQDENKAQGEIARMLAREHGNYMVVGDPAQCQPPETRVRKPGETTRIADLRVGDEVLAWNQNAQKLIARRVTATASRPYSGPMVSVEAALMRTRATPNHRFVARWTDRKSSACVVYLMHRADRGYRVGWCKLFAQSGEGSNSCHLAQRARIERATGVWVLRVCDARTDASVYESIIAAKYGIPTATFEPVHGAEHMTEESIARIFREVADENAMRGARCLLDHGRDPTLPLYPWPSRPRWPAPQGRRTIFQVYAANLMPELMSIPIAAGTGRTTMWAWLTRVESEHYEGMVHSLEVAHDETYVADGLVTHNSIYGFRGAHPEVLLRFAQEWPGARTILMHRNYRCGRAIAAAANGVLGAMDPETKLDMTITAERDLDGDVSLEVHEDMDDEARSVAARMLARHAEGVAWRDMATLYRTNAQSRSIEEALLAERVPHIVVGGTSFYNRKEVKDLLAYLRVAEGRARGEDVRRCLNAPFRYLGAAFVERVEAAEHDRGDRSWPDVVRDVGHQAGIQQRQRQSVEDWARIIGWMAREVEAGAHASAEGETTEGDALVGEGETRGMPAGILERLLTETKYLEWLARDEGTESTENSRSSNVREMVRVARRFRTATEFLDFVDETQDAQARAAQDRTADRVTLTTLHRSKGLEWRDVYLVSVNDRILPHARAEDPGEERRLFYVGVTRARDALRVSYVRTAALSAGNAALAPSHFLAEAGLSLGGKSTLLTPPDDDDDPSFPRDEDGVFDYATSRGIQ